MPYLDKRAEEEKAHQRTIRNVGLGGGQVETVQRYGSAAKEHLVAYTGADREAGKVLKRGLKAISQSKINPNCQEQNINQQAGFSAEVKTVAMENAEKIIARDKTRVVRTDDIAKRTTSAGTTIGGTNDQLYDLVTIDDKGIIKGPARQLKYVGSDSVKDGIIKKTGAEKCYDKLMSKDYDKYREAGAKIEIPKDYYNDVCQKLDQRAEDLKRQIANAQKRGHFDLAEKHERQLQRVEQSKDCLKQGKLTKEEAIEIRVNPEASTAKDIVLISHRAGFESAKTGLMIGGGVSFIRNSVAVIKGDETLEEGAIAVVKDTASAGILSYATGFVGSAIKGGMQNAESTFVRELSKTAAPAMIAVSVLETGKTFQRFASGQIDELQCLTELGEKASGIAASTVGMTIGQAMIPVPAIGGLIGSMCGYALSSAYYNTLTSALNDAKMAHEDRLNDVKMAHEERLLIEAECEEAIAAIREYRFEMEQVIRRYFSEYTHAFDNAFSQMQEAFNTKNVDLFVKGANSITETLGGTVLFRTVDELDALMASEDTITI